MTAFAAPLALVRRSVVWAVVVATLLVRATGAQPSPLSAVLQSSRIGDTVTIAGRALVASGVLQSRHLFVSVRSGDRTIWVYGRNVALRVREGDSVEARGVLTTYRGSLELITSSVGVAAGGPVPIAIPDTAWPAQPMREAELVRVHGVVGARGESEGGRWLRLHHGLRGDSLTLWIPWTHRDAPTLEDVRVGDQLDVTGLTSVYHDNPTDAPVAQIIPRRGSDIQAVGYPRRLMRQLREGVIALVAVCVLVVVTSRVVTRRHAGALQETEERYRQLLQLSPDAVLVHDGERVLFANAAAARLLGVPDEHALAGEMIAAFADADDRAALDASPESTESAAGERVRTTLRRSDGGVVDVEVATSPCRYHDRAAVVVVARDVGSQLRNERELRALALLDELTGLHNRRGFFRFAEAELRRLRERGSEPVLVFADLDGLKRINDYHGHGAGDEALRLVARAMRDVVGEQGLAARWSGDEFVALTSDITPGAASAEQEAADPERRDVRAAESFEQRLAAAIARHAAAASAFAVSASIGARRLDGNSADTILTALAAADAGLYRRRGRELSPTAGA